MKQKIKRTVKAISFFFMFALIPWGLLFIQDNNPYSDCDIEDYADFYNNDSIQKDTTVLFLDVSSNLVPVRSVDSLYYLTVDDSILIDFLRYISRIPYNCVLIDIQLFHQKIHTKYESELAMLLDSMYNMPQKVFFANERRNILPDSLKKHSVRINYEKNKFGMFVRGELMDMDNGEETAALKIFNSIHYPNTISPQELLITSPYHFYHIGVNIIRNNPVIKILKKDDYFDECNIIPLDSFKVPNLEDKLIIVGEMKRNMDKHYTYANKMEGPYLIYCEYKAIEKGQYLFSKRMLFIVFIVYFLILLFLSKIKVLFNPKVITNNKILISYIEKVKNETIRNYLREGLSLLAAIVDIIIKFVLIYWVLYELKTHLYYNYDFLYSKNYPLLYFTIWEIIGVFNHVKKAVESTYKKDIVS